MTKAEAFVSMRGWKRRDDLQHKAFHGYKEGYLSTVNVWESPSARCIITGDSYSGESHLYVDGKDYGDIEFVYDSKIVWTVAGKE